MPPPTLPPGAVPPFPGSMPPMRPPFPGAPIGGLMPPFPPVNGAVPGAPGVSPRGPPPAFVAAASTAPAPTSTPSGPVGAAVLAPKDGVFWPDNDAMPAEKRALQPRYRYTSPEAEEPTTGQKRKAAADFL